MIASNDRAYDTDLVSALSWATAQRGADLSLDDFNRLEGRIEILNDTRPDVIEVIHRHSFEAGAGAVDTKYLQLQSG